MLAVVPLTGVVAIASYCFGTFLAGVVFRFRDLNSRRRASSAIVGADDGLRRERAAVVLPDVLEWIARFLPLTNGLLAIRGVFDGEAWSWIIGHAALEGAVGVGWMTIALLTFNRLASRGRLDGSLDYGA